MLLAEFMVAYILLVICGGGMSMHCNKFINYPNSISGPIDPRDDENMTELARVE